MSDVPHVPFVPRFNYMHRGEVLFIFPTSSNVKENDVIGRVDLGFGTFSRVCVYLKRGTFGTCGTSCT